jgi:hypothetical protein
MTLGRSTSGAIKVKTDAEGGGLRAVSCGCCEPMIIFYSYATDSSLGAGWDQCPDVGQPCGWAEVGSCGGAVASGFLYSDAWPSIPLGKTAKAKIYAGACMDNWGNIGTALAGNAGTDDCLVGYTQDDVVDTAEVDEDKRMKIPFSVTNAPHGGPYGICGAMVEWYWE